MKKDKNVNTAKKMLIYIFFAILALFIIRSSFGFSPVNGYEYTIDKKAEYKVEVKKNNFFKEDYIGMNQTYISSVIDKILIDFDYKFKGNKEENINYSYDILAIMNVRYNSTNEVLWSKEDKIVEEQSIKLKNENEFKIQEDVEINFNSYNNKAKQFKSNFKIPVKSTLEIKLKVKQTIDLEDKVEEVATISLHMDLNEDVTTIDQKTTGLNQYKQIDDKQDVNVFLLIIGLIMLVASVSIILRKQLKMTEFNNKENNYTKAIKKILKNYGDVVAEIIKPVELNENTQIIDVKNFDQLLDVEEELRMPILFYEVERGKEGCFIIMNNNIAYRYILRNKK